jgi:hypothetical protein
MRLSFRIATCGFAACLLLGLAACKPQSPAGDADGATPEAAAPATSTETVAAAPVASGADAEIKAALEKFLAVKSYRATMTDATTGKTTADLEFVAPDRVRITMAGGMSQTIIGRTAYATMGGKTTKTELPPDMPTLADSSKKALTALETAKVEALEEDTVDGEEAKVYRAVLSDGGESKTWIAVDSGLPIKAESTANAGGTQVRMLMTYKDYNDPGIVIDAPQ